MEPAHELPNGRSRPKDFEYPEQMQVARRATLEWMPHLSDAEFKVVMWLLGNTVFRGHRSGVYSAPQIADGIPNRRDGGMWAEGTGLGERTVRKVMGSLRGRGLIHTDPDPRGQRVSVVITWSPESGHAEESNVVALNLPRARRAASVPDAHVQPDAHDEEWGGSPPAFAAPTPLHEMQATPCTEYTPSNAQLSNPHTYENEDCDAVASRPVALPEVRIRKRPSATGTSLNPPRSGFGKVDASLRCAAPPPAEPPRFAPLTSVEDAIKAASESRKARLAEARKRVDVRSYATTWLGAWGDTYPGTPCPGWSEKVGGMLKRSLKAYWLKGQEHRAHDFLEWSVRNWDVILAAKLSWMRQSPPPALPCAEFVARFLRNFQEAWGEQEELKFRGTEPGQRQAAYALAKREGITVDVALARVIARDASEKTMREANEVAARASRDKRVAKMAAERAERATRFTKENPHPRAHENVRERIPVPTVTEGMAVLQPVVFNPELFK